MGVYGQSNSEYITQLGFILLDTDCVAQIETAQEEERLAISEQSLSEEEEIPVDVIIAIAVFGSIFVITCSFVLIYFLSLIHI